MCPASMASEDRLQLGDAVLAVREALQSQLYSVMELAFDPLSYLTCVPIFLQ
jgi:hypothetical protein